MKNIRSLFCLLAWMIVSVSAWTQNSNRLVIPDVTAIPGETFQLPVEIQNDDDIVGVQFDLLLPGMDGDTPLFYVENTENVVLTERCSEFTLNFQLVDGVYRVLIMSTTNNPIRGKNGAVLMIPVTVYPGVNVENSYEPAVLNPVLTTKTGDNVLSELSVGKISFGQFPDLTVENVAAMSTSVMPGGTLALSWTVKNVGQKETADGFTEYIYLESEDETYSKLIGTVQFEDVIQSGSLVSRNTSVTLPELLGIDGNAKVKVRLSPYSASGEPESLQQNNSGWTDGYLTVGKMLLLSCDYQEVDENEVAEVGFRLSRSGRWDEEQSFSISALTDTRVSLPATVTLEQGQSEAYFYASVTNDDVLQDVEAQNIPVIVSGNGYDDVTAAFILNDDEMADLEVEASNYKIDEGDSFQLTVKTNRPSDNPVEVTLTCDNAKFFKFPSRVDIPAGQSSVIVDVIAIDDEVPYLDTDVLFTVSAPHHVKDEAGVILYDNDIPTLQLSLTPVKVAEGQGPKAVTAVLKRTDRLESKITVNISDDANGNLYYDNSTIEMPKGVSEVYFTLGPVDNAVMEGDRTYNISAAIYISACSCSVSGESAGAVSAQLTVLDDDGATLALSVADGALIEGGNTKVTVYRNTSTEDNLSVSLYSDSDEQLEYQHSVVIPAGKESVEVTIEAKKNSLAGDSKTVVFTAEAEGYSDGTCWVMLTDQSLPDAIVESVEVQSNHVEVGEEIPVFVTLKNVGNENLQESTCVKLYRKDTNELIATMYSTESIPVGQSETFNRTFKTPDEVGNYRLYAVVNEERDVKETIYTNNTSEELEINAVAPFSASLQTDKNIYTQGDKIVITGQLTGNKTANQDVEVYLINQGSRQTMNVTSLADGTFSAEWQLAQAESGHFIVGACYPKENLSEEMDAFDVYGLRRTNNSTIYCDVTEGDSYSGTVEFLNTSVLPLDGIEIQLLSKPDNADVSLEIPERIEGNQRINLQYQITGIAVSQENEWSDIRAVVKTAQGVSQNVLFKFYCRNKVALLATDHEYIKTTMVKGQTREYPLILTNFGKGNSGNISLVLPDFIKCASGNSVAPLNQNDSTTIILQLTPKDDMQLNVPVTGNLGIVCENGEGLTINFDITTVSEEKGMLKVDVMDEYTYYTAEAPHVKDAQVVIKNPVSGAIVAQGITADDGVFTIELPEGYYQLEVTADNHSSYSSSIIVDPGAETLKSVNLSVEAVTVTWDVKETEVEDEYQIVTTLKYETNVPVPVVELITPERIDADQLSVGESLIFYALMTNKGLITAKDTKLILPDDTRELTFEALAEYEDLTIAPQQSVRIPIKVTKINVGETKSRRKPSLEGSSCYGTVGNLYYWDCGTDRKWHAYKNALQWGSCRSGGNGGHGPNPNPAPSPTLPKLTQIVNKPNNIGPSDPVLAKYTSLISGLYSSSSNDEGCEPCQNSFLWKMSKCFAGKMPLIGQVLQIIDMIKLAKELMDDLRPGDFSNYVKIGDDWYNPVYGYVDKIMGYIPYYRNCLRPLIEECDPGDFGVKSRNGARRVKAVYPSYIKEFQNVLETVTNVVDAQYNISLELFGDERWFYADPTELYNFRSEFIKYVDGLIGLNELKAFKPQSVSESMYNSFIERWLNSVNGEITENRIDLDKVNEWRRQIMSTDNVLKEMGAESLVEMFEDAVQKVMDNLNLAAKSVCSSVTLQFTQNMVMTRQAFRGTLTVFNGHETEAMQDMKLTLNITSANGDVATSREFQINAESLEEFEGELNLQSGWTLQADKTGRASILFIPTKYAATDGPVDYYFGGTLTYVDPFTGLEVTRELYPVLLTVKPSPIIDLSYFVQRNVYGDDALTTDAVEPVIPAEFAVVINNKGKGNAENLRMITNQPVIVENEKGLLVDFSITSSQLNGNPANLAFGKTIANEFGTINANDQAYAQWWIESSLLGHFASYDVEASHLTSYGNENLSLLDKVTIHELIHGFTVLNDDDSSKRGFLVNDIEDAEDMPDHVFFSDATDAVVSLSTNATMTMQGEGEYILTVYGTHNGWTYGNLPDPTNGEAKIISVVRMSDNRQIPVDNVWQTYCTLVDGQEPTYEDLIHFIVDLSVDSESYLIAFDKTPDTTLAVESFVGLPRENTYIQQPLQSVHVVFNKPVDASSFTTQDISLHCGGVKVNTDAISIERVSDTEFSIVFNDATKEDGYYVLNVQAEGILDTEGFYGTDGKQCSWTQLTNVENVPDITISENEDNNEVLEAYDGELCNVSVSRIIKYGSYNTIVLPFDVDATTLRTVFGNDVKLKEMVNSVSTEDELTFIFENAESIEAGKPYIIKVEQNVINPIFNQVIIKNNEIVSKSEYADFVPVFSPVLLEDDNESIVFLGADNKLYYPSQSTGKMPGLRAYFVLADKVSGIKGFNLNVDDQPTIILQIEQGNAPQCEGIYTISGQKVNRPVQRGLYIINGKKIFIQ